MKASAFGKRYAWFQGHWHRFQVREPVQTPDPVTGDFTTKFRTLATVWGDMDPVSGGGNKLTAGAGLAGRFVRDVQVEEQPTHTIRMRNIPTLGITRSGLAKNVYLAVTDGANGLREFEIMSVTELAERGGYLVIVAKERRKIAPVDTLDATT